VTDGELRALCHRFFDAIERHDFDAVAEHYTSDATLWFNATGREISKQESLEILRKGAGLHRRRTYDDRSIQTFEGGFVVQYSVNVVLHDGRRASLWACAVAQCRDGRVARLDEYLDTGKFRPPVERAAGGRTAQQ
jgi:ketosteroid isomerase-like protein